MAEKQIGLVVMTSPSRTMQPMPQGHGRASGWAFAKPKNLPGPSQTAAVDRRHPLLLTEDGP